MSHSMQNQTNESREHRKSGLWQLKHFTWAWYTCSMSAGGLAILISPKSQAYSFPGLRTIGEVVLCMDVVLFILITIAIVYRFIRWPGTLKASITHPKEGLFVGAFWLAIASIIIGIAHYGMPHVSKDSWLITTYLVLFWVYFALTAFHGVAQFVIIFTAGKLTIDKMTYAWDLPIMPFMLSGTIAANGCGYMSPECAVPMIVAGVAAQGLGLVISVLMYASYIRMVQFGLPLVEVRPTMFIAVGPPGFTCIALMGMAENFPRHLHNYFGLVTANINEKTGEDITYQILNVVATFASIFVWALGGWFCLVAVMSNVIVARSLKFHLNWYAFIFPNVGLIIATLDFGKRFRSTTLKIGGTVLSIMLIMVFFLVLFCQLRAVLRREILWPGKDEDYPLEERKSKVVAVKRVASEDSEKGLTREIERRTD